MFETFPLLSLYFVCNVWLQSPSEELTWYTVALFFFFLPMDKLSSCNGERAGFLWWFLRPTCKAYLSYQSSQLEMLKPAHPLFLSTKSISSLPTSTRSRYLLQKGKVGPCKISYWARILANGFFFCQPWLPLGIYIGFLFSFQSEAIGWRNMHQFLCAGNKF